MGLFSVTSFVFALAVLAIGTYAEETESGSCDYNGQVYKDGEGGIEAIDGCNTCFCDKGAVGCTELFCGVECPLFKCKPCEYGYVYDNNGCQTCTCRGSCPDGSNPVNCLVDPCMFTKCDSGQTCVSNYCGGCNSDCVSQSCDYNGNVYENGETEIPAIDGCNTCVCNDGEVSCTKIGCGGSCPDGSNPVNCLVDPCMFTKCDSGQTCVSNYCGGCNSDCVADEPESCPDGKPTVKCSGEGCNLVDCMDGFQCQVPCGTCDTECVKVGKSCNYNGNLYKDGETGIPAVDNCNTCVCNDGEVGCTEMACVVGKSCNYNGNVYKDGERGIPAIDNCNTCVCNDGEVGCTEMACVGSCPDGSYPVACKQDPCTSAICKPGHKCVPNYCGGCLTSCVMCPVFKCRACEHGNVIGEDGCPTCTCQEAPVQSPVQCEYNGQTYEAGDAFDAIDGCNRCSCTDTGIVPCTKKFCLPPTCESGGKTYAVGDNFPSGDGCNGCTCRDKGLIVCTLITCPKKVCKYNEQKYEVGQTFSAIDGCNECECLETGGVSCTRRACLQCPVLKCATCSNGYLKDQRGCETCNCKPCGWRHCGAGEFCSNGDCCSNFIRLIRCADPCLNKRCRFFQKCERFCNCSSRCVWDWDSVFSFGFKK